MAKRALVRTDGPTLRDVTRMLADLHDHIVALGTQGATLDGQGKRLAIGQAHLLALATTLVDITTQMLGELARITAAPAGLADADFAEVTAAFATTLTRLQAVATDPDNPDPVTAP